MKKLLIAAFAAMTAATAFAADGASEGSAAKYTPLTDTNLQIFWDFGKDRKHVTTTYEMFHNDAWGNTFFFVDVDMNFRNTDDRNIGPSGAYTEIARCFNFWQNTPVGDLSLQAEYNGGLGSMWGGYTVNHAFLVGPNYCLHTKDYRYFLNMEVLYKKFIGLDQRLPMQFEIVWGCQDLFGAKGLRFSGFASCWWEGPQCVFLSEPQLWYSVGQWFNCPNLNIGGEVEVSCNFAGINTDYEAHHGVWKCRPCLGLKWVF